MVSGYRRLNRWEIRRLSVGDRSAYYQQLSYRVSVRLRAADRRVELLQRNIDELREQLQVQYQRCQAAEASTSVPLACDECQMLRGVVMRLQQECDRRAYAWMRLDRLMTQRPYRCCCSNTSGAPPSSNS